MKAAAKVLVASVAWVAGNILSFMLLAKLHVPPPDAIPGTTPEAMFRVQLLATPILAIAMTFLARGLGGSFAARLAALSAFIYVTLGINTVIEAAIFSTIKVTAFFYLQYILPAAVLSIVLAAWFKPKAPIEGPPRFAVMGWAWRMAAAWLAFPVIYWIFGMCVAPFVLDYYSAGIAGLRIPPVPVILRTQLLRSVLFLAASLPFILLWTKSRRSLVLSLGLAHAVCVGIYGLVQAYWFPDVLRVVHSIEITADSFAYAAVLTLLFTARQVRQPVPVPQTA